MFEGAEGKTIRQKSWTYWSYNEFVFCGTTSRQNFQPKRPPEPRTYPPGSGFSRASSSVQDLLIHQDYLQRLHGSVRNLTRLRLTPAFITTSTNEISSGYASGTLVGRLPRCALEWLRQDAPSTVTGLLVQLHCHIPFNVILEGIDWRQ